MQSSSAVQVFGAHRSSAETACDVCVFLSGSGCGRRGYLGAEDCGAWINHREGCVPGFQFNFIMCIDYSYKVDLQIKAAGETPAKLLTDFSAFQRRPAETSHRRGRMTVMWRKIWVAVSKIKSFSNQISI